MQEDITRLSEELAQISRAITEAEEQARGGGHPARLRLAELQERAGQLRAAIAVGGSVKDSILVVGNENRINQNQYILPSEPQQPLFVGVPPMPAHFVGREALVEVLVERLVTTGRVAISAEGLPGVGKTALAVAGGTERLAPSTTHRRRDRRFGESSRNTFQPWIRLRSLLRSMTNQ